MADDWKELGETLLKKYDPETYPTTKPVLELLSDEAREVVLSYTRYKQQQGLEIAAGFVKAHGAVGDLLHGDGGAEAIDFLHHLHDAYPAGLWGGRDPVDMHRLYERYNEIMVILARNADNSIDLTFRDLMEEPGKELMDIDGNLADIREARAARAAEVVVSANSVTPSS